MRVAAIADIHGNLPALHAVLDDIRQAGVDLLVVCGDVVAGPLPRATLECLLALDMPVQYVQGNADREVAALMAGAETNAVPEHVRAITEWVAQQLDSAHAAVLASWPATTRVEIEGLGAALFCHATPHNDTDIFTRVTPEAALLPVFAGLDVQLVVCGHTHMQFDRTIGGVRVVNAGSVGMPYGEPGAYWLLLGPEVQLRRTRYDQQAAGSCICATSYPQAEDFAANAVLQPPTEAEALAVFSPEQHGS